DDATSFCAVEQLPVANDVGRRFDDDDGEASRELLAERRLVGEGGRGTPGFADLGRVFDRDANALGHIRGHRSRPRVVATVVPRPTSERISNSFISRRLPLSPSPSPLPVV